jgi:hypothetical protein
MIDESETHSEMPPERPSESSMSRREFTRNALAAGGALLVGAHESGAAAQASSPSAVASEAGSSGGLTDVDGIRVGHFTESRRPTGCTVVLCEKGAVAGVDVRGGAPGTRETDLLNPVNTVQQIYGVILSGGSAFGLDTASGVMRYLDEKGIGFHLGQIVVPIVPAAILFDLNLGDPKIRPTADSGYAACRAANSGPVPEGNVGAGAGATIGKLFGIQYAMKSGLGTAWRRSLLSTPQATFIFREPASFLPVRAPRTASTCATPSHKSARANACLLTMANKKTPRLPWSPQMLASPSPKPLKSRKWRKTASRAPSTQRTHHSTAIRCSHSRPERWKPLSTLAPSVRSRQKLWPKPSCARFCAPQVCRTIRATPISPRPSAALKRFIPKHTGVRAYAFLPPYVELFSYPNFCS